MNTENQVAIVLLCIYAGILAGILYEPFGMLRLSVKNAAVRIAADSGDGHRGEALGKSFSCGLLFSGIGLYYPCPRESREKGDPWRST